LLIYLQCLIQIIDIELLGTATSVAATILNISVYRFRSAATKVAVPQIQLHFFPKNYFPKVIKLFKNEK